MRRVAESVGEMRREDLRRGEASSGEETGEARGERREDR
jgi:hypothetical protein